MFNEILKFVQDNINIIVPIIFTGLGYIIKTGIDWLILNKSEKNKYLNNVNLQRESYFKESNGKELHSLFDSWLRLFMNTENEMKKYGNKKASNELFIKTILYGSAKTIKICSIMQNYNYFMQKQDNNSQSTQLYMLFLAELIASLKFDLTGYQIDSEDLLKIHITDFTEQSKTELYIENKKIIKKVLEDCDKKLEKN